MALEAERVGTHKKSRRDIAVGISASDVEEALAEWRRIGPSAFHEKYGTHSAHRFVIADPDGTEFDAKEILIGARANAGLSGANEEFRGDRTTVEEPLSRLGFLVEDLADPDQIRSAEIESTPPDNRARAVELARQFAGKTDATGLRGIRREQRTLRWALGLGDGSNVCAICGRELPDRLLVAAHIKKRAACDESERIDIPAVAFVACLLGCDALYENGYVSVDDEGLIVAVRESPDSDLRDVVNGLVGKKAEGVSEFSSKYFAWHREYWRGQLV